MSPAFPCVVLLTALVCIDCSGCVVFHLHLAQGRGVLALQRLVLVASPLPTSFLPQALVAAADFCRCCVVMFGGGGRGVTHLQCAALYCSPREAHLPTPCKQVLWAGSVLAKTGSWNIGQRDSNDE